MELEGGGETVRQKQSYYWISEGLFRDTEQLVNILCKLDQWNYK